MNGYVEAGYLAVLGGLGGYSAVLVGKSRKMKKALLPIKVEDKSGKKRSAE